MELELAFSGEVIHWRGPAPHHFVPVPPEPAAELAEAAAGLSYGWGCIPVVARTGDTTWTTSLIPRHGGYLVPLKAAVRRAEGIELGDTVAVQLTASGPRTVH